MNPSRHSRATITGFGMLLALSTTNQNCLAANVYFIQDVVPPIDGDFNSGANWSDGLVPSLNPTPPSTVPNIYGIDDGLSATFFGGSTMLQGLRVGSADKFHTLGENHYGRLTMMAGSLGIIGNNTLDVGRENQTYYPPNGDYNLDSVVDAADYTVWRDTLGSSVTPGTGADGDNDGTVDQSDYDFWRARFGNVPRGGQINMTGSSTLTAYGSLIGERNTGVITVGPNALLDNRLWSTTDETYGAPAYPPVTITGPHFSPVSTTDIHIGGYGPAYNTFGAEPGLDGRGLVDVHGTLNANGMYVSEHGAQGEIRLSGGTVNLNGPLIMSWCDGCVLPDTNSDKALLALQSSKVSIIGSTGSFKVGIKTLPLNPDPSTIMPFIYDIRSDQKGPGSLAGHPETATFSFTADAGGVTPITIVDNGLDMNGKANYSGTAYIGGTNLVLNLDAYTSAAPLTLIDAPVGMVTDPAPADPTPHFHLVGTFGTVTFLGHRTATVNYDYANGDVFLNNFHLGPGSAASSNAAVPEPTSYFLMCTMGACLGPFVRQRRRLQPAFEEIRG
jgi:hypothetical protein